MAHFTPNPDILSFLTLTLLSQKKDIKKIGKNTALKLIYKNKIQKEPELIFLLQKITYDHLSFYKSKRKIIKSPVEKKGIEEVGNFLILEDSPFFSKFLSVVEPDFICGFIEGFLFASGFRVFVDVFVRKEFGVAYVIKMLENKV